LKANKVNLFVSSVLFVFWYHSPNVLDTLHICNISWLRVNNRYAVRSLPSSRQSARSFGMLVILPTKLHDATYQKDVIFIDYHNQEKCQLLTQTTKHYKYTENNHNVVISLRNPHFLWHKVPVHLGYGTKILLWVLMDITTNTFYNCTATFRKQISRKCLGMKLNGFRPV
jgi:hypothetical protein